MKRHHYIFTIFLFLMVGIILMPMIALAQDKGGKEKALTQEEFAVALVKAMNLQGWLPTAAIGRDCVALLERMGISPLNGWHNDTLLSQEDYLVILAKAHGREKLLHERAYAVEQKNREIINQRWQEVYKKTGKWPTLQDLLNNKEIFPKGPPKSPYGLRYQDRNNDHKVDKAFFPVVRLIRLRAKFF